jgi:hypothetical protein
VSEEGGGGCWRGSLQDFLGARFNIVMPAGSDDSGGLGAGDAYGAACKFLFLVCHSDSIGWGSCVRCFVVLLCRALQCILSTRMFTMLILMAISTTCMPAPGGGKGVDCCSLQAQYSETASCIDRAMTRLHHTLTLTSLCFC